MSSLSPQNYLSIWSWPQNMNLMSYIWDYLKYWLIVSWVRIHKSLALMLLEYISLKYWLSSNFSLRFFSSTTIYVPTFLGLTAYILISSSKKMVWITSIAAQLFSLSSDYKAYYIVAFLLWKMFSTYGDSEHKISF